MPEPTLHVPLAKSDRLGLCAGERAAKLRQVELTVEVLERCRAVTPEQD
ncbi:MAG TPA: hypothetical protein VGB85_05710 [Nannocystis sp.]